MNAASEQSVSLWMDKIVADATALDGDMQADVVVVGSGIAELSEDQPPDIE
jgi:hypothetical protein